MEILFDITKMVVCAVFLISIIVSIGLLVIINKKQANSKMFSVEPQDLD